MISLIIPPKDQVSRAAKMLAEEFVCRMIPTTPRTKMLTEIAGYRLEHQVPCQSTLRPIGHYLDPAASQAILQGPTKWARRVLR
jgi:hypothetical protein